MALLISEETGSAAEIFAMYMRVMPQVSLIGEATQGALSDVLVKGLPNHWLFTLSNEEYVAADGNGYEGTGIPADIEALHFRKNDRDLDIDRILEAAISWSQSYEE